MTELLEMLGAVAPCKQLIIHCKKLKEHFLARI